MIDAPYIKELLKNSPSNLLCREFELKPKNIAMYIAAMANTVEGYIVIGVTREKNGYKLNNISRTYNYKAIIETAQRLLSTMVEVEHKSVYIDGTSVFVIKVYRSPKEIFLGDRKYIIENNEIIRLEGENKMDMTKVFIVHGHDNEAKQAVARFVEKLGFEAIILHEQVNHGRTIIEKIEENTNVGYAIVLYTPCDLGKAKEDGTLKERARQNVIFEHDYLIGKLKRERVVALVKGNIEKPNDLSGVVYIDMDSAGAWKIAIAREMKSVGYNVDMNKIC